jgi:hypothetical protein
VENYCSLKFPALRGRSNNLRKGGLALRKFIFIVLSVFLLLSFTALAYAEMDIKLGGRILVRGWYWDNVDLGPGTISTIPASALTDAATYEAFLAANPEIAAFANFKYGEFTRLGTGELVLVPVSQVSFLPVESTSHSVYTTNAYITIDAKVTDNVQGFMELETSDNQSLGVSGIYKWGTHDEKPVADLFFRQLWIQYTGSGLLGAPAGIKLGHQVWALGEKQFLNHERFGDDAIVLFVQPTKELYLGGVIGKLQEGVYQDNTDDLDIYTILGTYKLDKDNTLGINYSYVSFPDLDLQFSNLGLHANGLIGGALTYAAELDFQFGSVFDTDSPVPGIESMDYKGWAFMAKAGYKLDPVNLRAGFAIGSGDKDDTDDKIEEFQVTMGSDAVSPIARYVHYTQIYERSVATSAFAQTLDAGKVRNTGIANTTYYNLGVDLMATKDINLSLDGFILRATKTIEGSKSIGSEIDFKGSYKIAKNLTYFVEAGALFTGDFYKDSFGIDDKSVTQIVHGLNLTF